MVLNESLYNIPIETFTGLITALKALGWVIVAYIAFNIANMIINRKKKKQLEKINKNLEDIKKILKKKK